MIIAISFGLISSMAGLRMPSAIGPDMTLVKPPIWAFILSNSSGVNTRVKSPPTSSIMLPSSPAMASIMWVNSPPLIKSAFSGSRATSTSAGPAVLHTLATSAASSSLSSNSPPSTMSELIFPDD